MNFCSRFLRLSIVPRCRERPQIAMCFLSVSLFCNNYSFTVWNDKNYFLFLVIPVHTNQLDSGVLLVYSALFCCHSASFRYIPVPFLFIPSHSGVIRFYSRVIPPCSSIFRFILVYSALFLCHSASFRCHSASFWYISVSFRLIPAYSGLFRYIPFHSVPFLYLVTPQV